MCGKMETQTKCARAGKKRVRTDLKMRKTLNFGSNHHKRKALAARAAHETNDGGMRDNERTLKPNHKELNRNLNVGEELEGERFKKLEAQWGKPLGRVSAYRRPSREESPAEASPLGPNLDGGLCTAIARALQAHLQLSLFNFDLIKDADGHMYVIDINFFPGLSKVPGYEQIFLEFLAESCTEPPD